MFRDLDLLPQDRPDTRRLEVVADGLPLHHGAQLAIDTVVSPLRRYGVPRPWSMTVDGGFFGDSRRRDVTQSCRASLGEHIWWSWRVVGGRWSDETRDFLRHLAKAKVRGEPFPVQRRAEVALVGVSSWLAVQPKVLLCLSSKHAPLTGEVIVGAPYEPVVDVF